MCLVLCSIATLLTAEFAIDYQRSDETVLNENQPQTDPTRQSKIQRRYVASTAMPRSSLQREIDGKVITAAEQAFNIRIESLFNGISNEGKETSVFDLHRPPLAMSI